jgi:death-on-curing protein
VTRYLAPGDIVYIHRQAMLDEGQQSTVIDHEKIEAAAARPQTTVFGDEAYPTLAGKAAALMQSLVVGHPLPMATSGPGWPAPSCFCASTASPGMPTRTPCTT